jgi:hypothetical protein
LYTEERTDSFSVAVSTLTVEIAPRTGDIVSETALFAIDDEASDLHQEMGLAVYRRLNVRQRVAYAAELKRKISLEIAEQGRSSRRRQRGFFALLAKSLFGR